MSAAVIVYAFTLGLVAAVNPCGFPLLPAYLVSFVSPNAVSLHRRAARAISAGACVTAGFVVTFGVAGIVVSSGVALIIDWVPWIMVVVGLVLLALGLATVAGRWRGLALPAVSFRTGRSATAMTGFGVAYAVGSLSCALPLFLAGVVTVFTHSGWLDGVSAFVSYAIGMGLFVTAAGLVVAILGSDAVRSMRRLSRYVPLIGGILITAVGAYLIYYWVLELIDPTALGAVVRWVNAIPTDVSGWLTASPLVSAVLFGAVVVAGMSVVIWTPWRRALRPKEMEHNE